MTTKLFNIALGGSFYSYESSGSERIIQSEFYPYNSYNDVSFRGTCEHFKGIK